MEQDPCPEQVVVGSQNTEQSWPKKCWSHWQAPESGVQVPWPEQVEAASHGTEQSAPKKPALQTHDDPSAEQTPCPEHVLLAWQKVPHWGPKKCASHWQEPSDWHWPWPLQVWEASQNTPQVLPK